MVNLVKWSSMYAILGIGASFVIISGGIDLSVGSVIALIGVVFPMLVEQTDSIGLSLALVMGMAGVIGLVNGCLVAIAKLQPFVVTLCGLMFYRSLARTLTVDQNRGFGDDIFQSLRDWTVRGRIDIPWLTESTSFRLPVQTIYLLVVAAIAFFFLTYTVWGRHLYALGRNPEAARFSGIRTKLLTVGAYVVCSVVASGLGGLLFALEVNDVQPSNFGNFYELYAIAAAVIGGCSLRGGEGSVFGVLVGAGIFQLLYNSSRFLGFPPPSRDAIIAIVILAGALLEVYGRDIWNTMKALVFPAQAKTGGQDSTEEKSPDL
jgi:ribose transport system permease protein